MDTKTRLAIIDFDKCKPKECKQECKKSCPVVRMGKKCIEVNKCAEISESLCIGCGLCVKACPFNAIKIINIPNNLKPVVFKYGTNMFQLHSLPQPRPNTVLGIIGSNGIGKSTITKLFMNKLRPNFGLPRETKTDEEIITHFRGAFLQNYFENLYLGDTMVKLKPQHLNSDSTVKVSAALQKHTEHPNYQLLLSELQLEHLLTRTIDCLSGGELQRLAIALTCLTKVDKKIGVFVFDEPSNFLDVKQRLAMARAIDRLRADNTYIIVIEHDIAILDFISDYVCCLYGSPSNYGVCSLPYTVREGINYYLDGFLAPENMRIRDYNLKFISNREDDFTEEELQTQDIENKTAEIVHYPQMEIKLDSFSLTIEKGGWKQSEIIVLVGQNGSGKTTFVRMLAGLQKTDQPIPEANISYKPQRIKATYQGTVQNMLLTKIGSTMSNPLFKTDVIKPLRIEELYQHQVSTLSGGEIQRVAIATALGKPADIYLLDEPLSMLDVEMRLLASTAIKRYIRHIHKMCYVVEHDILLSVYLADRIIYFGGDPGVRCFATAPMNKEAGMNVFLKNMNITLRKDLESKRPRINKPDSGRDREQKKNGVYFDMKDL